MRFYLNLKKRIQRISDESITSRSLLNKMILVTLQFLKISFDSKFKLVYKNFLKCANVILLVKNQHSFFIIY